MVVVVAGVVVLMVVMAGVAIIVGIMIVISCRRHKSGMRWC